MCLLTFSLRAGTGVLPASNWGKRPALCQALEPWRNLPDQSQGFRLYVPPRDLVPLPLGFICSLPPTCVALATWAASLLFAQDRHTSTSGPLPLLLCPPGRLLPGHRHGHPLSSCGRFLNRLISRPPSLQSHHLTPCLVASSPSCFPPQPLTSNAQHGLPRLFFDSQHGSTLKAGDFVCFASRISRASHRPWRAPGAPCTVVQWSGGAGLQRRGAPGWCSTGWLFAEGIFFLAGTPPSIPCFPCFLWFWTKMSSRKWPCCTPSSTKTCSRFPRRLLASSSSPVSSSLPASFLPTLPAALFKL